MIARLAREIETECAGIMGKRISTERARIFAKVIIEAMREPTEAMLAISHGCPAGDYCHTEEVWQNMIDAALQEDRG